MKTAVAMSGGVDSSVAAYLLKSNGYEITGITMRHYDAAELGFSSGKGIESDIDDAAEVCSKMDIPHLVIDVRKEFHRKVITDFLREYSRGRTPNPCALCNPAIKWGVFLDRILSRDFDRVATGHYVRSCSRNDRIVLKRGKDLQKDQSYMLWGLDQKQLGLTLFPLGEMRKDEVRRLAIEHKLPVHEKQESQEICFINGHYESFIRDNIELEPGDIVFKDGRMIGQHKGLPLYTIGQRKGLNLPWTSALFVVRIDPENNILHVSDDPADLMRDSFVVDKLNWISCLPKPDTELEVQIRYNSRTIPVRSLDVAEGELKVTLKEPARAITPGQSAVFYRQQELIGGGLIK